MFVEGVNDFHSHKFMGTEERSEYLPKRCVQFIFPDELSFIYGIDFFCLEAFEGGAHSDACT